MTGRCRRGQSRHQAAAQTHRRSAGAATSAGRARPCLRTTEKIPASECAAVACTMDSSAGSKQRQWAGGARRRCRRRSCHPPPHPLPRPPVTCKPSSTPPGYAGPTPAPLQAPVRLRPSKGDLKAFPTCYSASKHLSKQGIMQACTAALLSRPHMELSSSCSRRCAAAGHRGSDRKRTYCQNSSKGGRRRSCLPRSSPSVGLQRVRGTGPAASQMPDHAVSYHLQACRPLCDR